MLELLYTALLYLIQPLIWIRLWVRGRKAPAYRKRWGERYGFYRHPLKPGGIMLHSVSVGETLAAIPLVRALRHRYPDLPITVTTMTPTGSERVQSAFGKDVQHVYLPYDLPDALNRFLNKVDPKLVLIMETELWPNLIAALHKRKIPLVIANARLSARSAAGYAKLGKFVRRLLRRITLIAAQNEEDGARFVALGAKNNQVTVTGSLKFDISVTPQLAAKAVTLRRQWAPHRPVWIATSTHEGEESVVIAAHQALLQQFPNLLLILVPRHPERFPDAINLVRQAGLSYITRSSGEVPSTSTQVVVGDTMGELMLLYGIADLAFVGGSLVERGGHNPLEAAAHAIPVLMGPHTFNFKDICARLEQASGLITVTDATTLAKEVSSLLTDADYRSFYGRHAVEVLYQNQGAVIAAHQALLQQFPNLLLILVPRHPERFPDAINLVRQAGLSYITRSSGEVPSTSTQVVVGDTMGELMLLYGIADLAFVGGSLVERGGHNPLEAAAHAIPVLMGPHTFNFKDICARLEQASGLITVTDATTLAKEVSSLLTDADYRSFYGRHAVEVLYQNQGALQRLLQLLEPYLPPKTH